jgi:hypothetical protein
MEVYPRDVEALPRSVEALPKSVESPLTIIGLKVHTGALEVPG